MGNRRIISVGLIVSTLFFLLSWTVNRLASESTPVARGAVYALAKGCTDCHGLPNNYLIDFGDQKCSDLNQMPGHPEYDVQCTDALAYFEIVRLRRNARLRLQGHTNNLLASGEYLARKYHCFNCHGYLGQGGFKNPNSLKGYIPGYFGSDFKTLTGNADPESVRQWILHGVDSAILETPFTGRIAKYFFDRQAIKMPIFKSLNTDEIDILVNYVITLNQFGPMTASTIRSYARASTQSSNQPVFHASRDKTAAEIVGTIGR